MKRFILTLLASVLCIGPLSYGADGPIRVFIRSGPKSHGPGAHDFPAFLKEWVPLLNERGAKADGGDAFPTKAQLDNTDVLILHAQEAGNIAIGEERKNLLEFLKRGGGMVVIHAGAVSRDPDWFKSIVGGSWRFGTTKWLEAPMSLYFTDRENPITRDIANFDIDDEIYYDMDILPEVTVLAGAYTPKPRDTGGKGNKEAQQRAAEAVAKGKAVNIYDIQPQMWTYQRTAEEGSTPYRAFVCIPGHYHKNFSHNGLRTALLRGIAWAAKRENADMLCKPEELGDALRYVEGGPPRPQEMPKHLEVHPEFNISLVAAEPLINKPMNVDWDEKGRLWVCETPEYPNGRRVPKEDFKKEAWKDSGSLEKVNRESGIYPDADAVYQDREPQDRISILTDSDGDGVMDKKTVFADKLELCTSFCFYKNGVIASAAPDIWFLEDTNGDDVADKRTKLYTGLGTGDTHAVINNLRWGQDGWIYATHGYSSGHVTSGDGSKDFGVDGAGVVRFKPDGSAFEQYASRGGNTWGLDMTWDGRVFYTQPTSGNHFIQVVLPEYVLAKGKLPGVMGTNGMLPKEPVFPAMHAEQQAYVQIDQVGSYTAAAGCAIYEGGAWPAKWNYGYFTTEPTVNIVSHFMVEPDGVAYKAHREPGREQNEFIRSNNIWFRPIEVRVGPEGALYVVDFCNQAVIHNDTRGPVHGPANAAVRPDRDHYYGRIWKVQHKEAKKLVVPTMDKKDSSVLARSILRSENGPTSQLAWRLFRENIGLDKLHEVQNSIYTSEKERQEFGKADSHEINTRLALDAAVNFWAERPATIDSDPVTPATEAEYVVHLTKGLRDAQPQTPEQWYKTLFAVSRYKAGRALIVEHYVKESPDDWTRSAVIAAAAAQPAACIEEALASLQADQLTKFVEVLVPAAIQQGGVKELVMSCASAPASANSLKAVILAALSQQSGIDLASSPELKEALQKLLSDGSTSASALPLIARWDSKGEMSSVVESMKKKMLATLQDGSAPQADSIAAAQGLFAIRQVDKALVGTLLETLASERPLPLREAILTVLSTGNEAEIGSKLAANISKMKPLENKVIDVLLARPAWSQSLLDAVERGEVSAADLGPSNVSRLRTHPNKQVAIRANKMLEKLSPTSVAKIQLIAQLTPEVEKPGDPVKGKMYYAACAVCHKLGDVGAAVGPPLDGMGAHGPAELLVHIVDPNREVDPSFWAQNITTKKGDIIVGVITSENASTITLATQLGVKEVAKIDIATRENTRRSLMPEGLEGLGAETLRDLLAYICGDALKHFRILDLKPAYTADSREGVFAGPSPKQGQVRLAKYGNVKVNGIPFFIQDAAKSSTGANIIVLKGGPQNSQSWTYPQRVEVPVNASAKKLHLLSGIAGWGYPAVRDHVPAVKATVTYASGETEEIVMKNGEEFSDYIRPSEVPGSQLVEDGISADQQVRLISLTLAKTGIIKSLALESFANGVAPVIIAVTADVEGKLGAKVQPAQTTEAKPATQAAPAPAPNADQPGPKEGGKGDGKLAPVTPVSWEAGKTKVLIVGGGSSHNFAKFFGEVDGATLKDAGFSVNYTEDRDQAAAELASADVAVISVNRQFFDFPAYRKALFDRIAAGKGVIMMHPGTWYAYPRWPELNAQIVGGGSRGHDKLGPYSVNVTKADHPIMKGVPASFDVVDELYYVNAEPDKTPAGTAAIEVLAETSPSQKFSKPHPSVWITKNDKARIACIALGHDERTHGDAAFKSILVNAVKWCAGK